MDLLLEIITHDHETTIPTKNAHNNNTKTNDPQRRDMHAEVPRSNANDTGSGDAIGNAPSNVTPQTSTQTSSSSQKCPKPKQKKKTHTTTHNYDPGDWKEGCKTEMKIGMEQLSTSETGASEIGASEMGAAESRGVIEGKNRTEISIPKMDIFTFSPARLSKLQRQMEREKKELDRRIKDSIIMSNQCNLDSIIMSNQCNIMSNQSHLAGDPDMLRKFFQ